MNIKICFLLWCVITVAHQEQGVGQSQIPPTPHPQPAQTIISKDSIPQQTHPGDISNVSPQDVQKLLHEESIRAQLHSNSTLNLADLAKLTPEQQQLFAAKLAEQSRLAYERAQKEEKQRQQKQHEQMQKLLASTKLQKSQEIMMTERLKLKSLYFKEGYSDLLSSTKDYLFDMEPNTEQEFLLSLTVGQDIAFVTTIYTNRDGVYVRPTGREIDDRLTLQIFENNTMIMYESQTFYSDGHVFKGQPNATYYFRFINSQNHRLIFFKTSIIVEQNHINSKATSADVSNHASRTKNIHETLQNRLTNSDIQLTLAASNRRRLTSQIRMYYLYTIAQMVIFVVLAFVQVEMIRKLLGQGSIV